MIDDERADTLRTTLSVRQFIAYCVMLSRSVATAKNLVQNQLFHDAS